MTTISTNPSAPSTSSSPSGGESAPKAIVPAKAGYVDRFRALPPTYQWAMIIAFGIFLYVFAQDYLWAPARSLNEESDRIARALVEGSQRDDVIRRVSGAIAPIGRIAVPRAEKDGSEELTRSITEVCNTFHITPRLNVRPGGNMNAPPELIELVGASNRLGKVTGDIVFSAPQDVVTKVLAALEARPEIESISRLKLTRNDKDKKVDVNMTVDAWVQVVKKKTGGGAP